MKRHNWFKRLLLTATLSATLAVSYVTWQYHSVSSYTAEPVQSDVIIVLGAAVYGTKPSPALQERCDWAYQLYQQGYAPKLILSGGLGGGEITEAQAMKDYLLQKGVPEEAMLLEENSHSTRENLYYSQKIMETAGMDSAIITTHRFHQKRANVLAAQLDLNATSYGHESQTGMDERYYTLRETAALLKEYVQPL